MPLGGEAGEAPGGAVPAGTQVLIRFRTFHNDVGSVGLRLYDVNANGQHIVQMTRTAQDVSCYQADLEQYTCDFWQAAVKEENPNNLWYRFIVTDGSRYGLEPILTSSSRL